MKITREMYMLAKKVIESYEQENPYKVTISAKYLKEKRLALNMSMQDVKDNTGVSKSTISRVEKGEKCLFDTVMTLYDFYRDSGV